MTVTNSTISGNTADGGGGISGGRDVTVTNSTITGNTANGKGGTIYAGDGGGVFAGDDITLTGSIVAGNATAGDYPDVRVRRGDVLAKYSIVGDASGSQLTPTGGFRDENGNLIGSAAEPIDPRLGPLADNGGPTMTHALLPGSPAINAGNPGFRSPPQFDQRGAPFDRVVGGRIDIGAYERQSTDDFVLLVDTVVDESDGDYILGDLSLREAIELANRSLPRETIRFDTAGVFATPRTIVLSMGELRITDSLTLSGPGAKRLTIDANQQSRTFNIDDGIGESNIDVEIDGVTITGGRTIGSGGGILNRANLSVTNSTISGNTEGEGGGGISTESDPDYAISNLTVRGSTISGNSARRGGGISADSAGITFLWVRNSTISGNSAGKAVAGFPLTRASLPSGR